MQVHRFGAMGTVIELLLDAPENSRADRALAAAEHEFHRLEDVLTRFRPDSELSRLNAIGQLDAGPDLLRVVELALAARERTAGRFDPTVHDAVVAAGYDRTFASVAPDGPDVSFRAGARCGGGVEIEHGTIRLERDVRLDLGGIGKGYAVDRACELLGLAGPCLVNAGGDLAVRGGAWPIAVPDGPTLELSSGALATSGRDRRRWRRGGEERHHLIDPETALPAEGPLLRVTVVAATATEAEVLAKAAFLGAEVDAPRVLVMADGTVVLAGGLA
jgi:thiamine biosynthesis lipoprotein